MKSKITKLLTFVLCISLLVCALPMTAYGATGELVKTIDLNSSKNLKGDGYSWNAERHVLTLNNANLSAKGMPVFLLDKEADVKIILKGESTLTCDGAAAISSGDSKTGGRLTITGEGTLNVNGYLQVNSKEVTIANSKLNIQPISKSLRYRSFTNSGKGSFIVTGQAEVTMGDGLNTGSAKDKLIVNGAYLNVTSDNFGPTIDVSDDIIVKNGGILRAYNTFKADVNDRTLSDAIYTWGDFRAEKGSIIEVVSNSGIGIRAEWGDLKLLGQEMHIQGGKQAVRAVKYNEAPAIRMPKDVNWSYSAANVTVEENKIFAATLVDNDNPSSVNGISYNYSKDTMSGGVKEISFEAEAVKQAKRKMASTEIAAYAKAFKKTDDIKRHIKVWWALGGDEEIVPTGYEVARGDEKDAEYQIIYYTLHDRYLNTAQLEKGKGYYYKVRAYIQVNDTLYYSDWSDIVYAAL